MRGSGSENFCGYTRPQSTRTVLEDYFKRGKRSRTYLFGGQGFLLSCVPLNLEVAISFWCLSDYPVDRVATISGTVFTFFPFFSSFTASNIDSAGTVSSERGQNEKGIHGRTKKRSGNVSSRILPPLGDHLTGMAFVIFSSLSHPPNFPLSPSVRALLSVENSIENVLVLKMEAAKEAIYVDLTMGAGASQKFHC